MASNQFFERCVSIADKLSNVYVVCYQLKHKDMDIIFDLIEKYMGIKRVQGDKFDMGVLGRLKDAKSENGFDTLLHQIVMKFIEELKTRNSAPAFKDYGLPTPHPSDMSRASEINFDQVRVELSQLKRELDLWRERVKELNPSGANSESSLSQTMELDKATIDLKGLRDKLRETEDILMWTRIYSKFPIDEPTSAFFGAWVAFCNDFKTIWNIEKARVLVEEEKERDAAIVAGFTEADYCLANFFGNLFSKKK